VDETAAHTYTLRYSRWRRRWVGRCSCGATLKPIFRDRADRDLPRFFMELCTR
jgi:hypothetical protein